MHPERATYQQKWIAAAGVAVGIAVIVVGFFLRGRLSDDIGRVGVLICVGAFVRMNYLARTEWARLTYRYLRHQPPQEPPVQVNAPDPRPERPV